jgi:hypothetical protein
MVLAYTIRVYNFFPNREYKTEYISIKHFVRAIANMSLGGSSIRVIVLKKGLRDETEIECELRKLATKDSVVVWLGSAEVAPEDITKLANAFAQFKTSLLSKASLLGHLVLPTILSAALGETRSTSPVSAYPTGRVIVNDTHTTTDIEPPIKWKPTAPKKINKKDIQRTYHRVKQRGPQHIQSPRSKHKMSRR